jgi:hypothetical protein
MSLYLGSNKVSVNLAGEALEIENTPSYAPASANIQKDTLNDDVSENNPELL